MDKLPQELLEKIICNKVINIQDVVSIASTCKYLHDVVLNNSVIWKQKFYDKWTTHNSMHEKCNCNFFEEVRYIYSLQKRAIEVLETMPPRFYRKFQLSDTDFNEWVEILQDRHLTYHYLVAILLEIIRTNECIKSIEIVPLRTPGNKTMQYYANKALMFIKHRHLRTTWINYFNLPAKKQTLEKGATFVAQWCQTDQDITEYKISSECDVIANAVKARLFETNPNHPVLKTPQSKLEQWKTENLDKNQWTVPECRQIIVAMREVMYADCSFCGNTEHYYQPENSYIDRVLETKKGLPIILAIIYESVGRRLGLSFQPINFPVHFLLRFTEGEGVKPATYYIDPFNGSNVVQGTGCPYSMQRQAQTLFPVATAEDVVERIANNLHVASRQDTGSSGQASFLRTVLELLVVITPQDFEAVMRLAKLYTLHRIDTTSLEEYILLQSFHEPDQLEAILGMIRGFAKHNIGNEPQISKLVVQRPSDLKYAVGMIMTTNNQTCVIYGWHPEYPALPECPGTFDLPYAAFVTRSKQPFYNVLVEDGTYRYVPQGMLQPASDAGLLHSNKDLGRHFSHFFVNHFVPNEEKAHEYPFDTKIRHKFYQNMLLSHYKP